MTGTQPDAPPAEPFLPDEEYEAQLRELEQQFPVPTWDEVKLEWKWLYESSANNTFDPENKYSKLNVAIYNQRVVGTDPHWMRPAHPAVARTGRPPRAHRDRVALQPLGVTESPVPTIRLAALQLGPLLPVSPPAVERFTFPESNCGAWSGCHSF